jgi:hypothetical protein
MRRFSGELRARERDRRPSLEQARLRELVPRPWRRVAPARGWRSTGSPTSTGGVRTWRCWSGVCRETWPEARDGAPRARALPPLASGQPYTTAMTR